MSDIREMDAVALDEAYEVFMNAFHSSVDPRTEKTALRLAISAYLHALAKEKQQP